jgi:hypothetical protein
VYQVAELQLQIDFIQKLQDEGKATPADAADKLSLAPRLDAMEKALKEVDEKYNAYQKEWNANTQAESDWVALNAEIGVVWPLVREAMRKLLEEYEKMEDGDPLKKDDEIGYVEAYIAYLETDYEPADPAGDTANPYVDADENSSHAGSAPSITVQPTGVAILAYAGREGDWRSSYAQFVADTLALPMMSVLDHARVPLEVDPDTGSPHMMRMASQIARLWLA